MARKIKALTHQQDRFVRAYGEPASKTYGNASASARLAGYKNPSLSASQMLGKEFIKAAVNKIREQRMEKEELTIQYIKDEYIALYKSAKDKGDMMSAIKCLHDMTKMLGGFIDVQRATVVNEFKDITHERRGELEVAARAIAISLSSSIS